MPKKVFLVDAYALIFKYYYAFMRRPMRNRAGMNTSIVFGFTKFLRDIQKREHPDLIGVAFDPKGGTFRNEMYPEYKANRPATPEDIIASVPYIKRLLDAMYIPILEVEGYEADDVIGTLAHKGVQAGYEVYMVTPDKDYGQLVDDHCSIYRQKDDGIEILGRKAICDKYGIDDPVLVRDILALWGDSADNIPGVPGIGEKSACKLVQTWGTCENILQNVSSIKGRQGESIAAWGDKLLLAKRLTTICLDAPIEFVPDNLVVCPPNIDALRALFAELDFRLFMNDLSNLAPLEDTGDIPHAAPQTQLADATWLKTHAAQAAALAGQGDLFDTTAATDSISASESDLFTVAAKESASATEKSITAVGNTAAERDILGAEYDRVSTVEHEYTIAATPQEVAEVVRKVSLYDEFCFDTETSGFDIFNDRIVGMSIAVEPHKAWYIPFDGVHNDEYAALLRPLFADAGKAKVGQNIKFDIMVLSRIGIEVAGPKYDTMIMHYLLDPEARHNLTALSIRYLNYAPIEIETLIGRGAKQLTMDMVAVERVAEYCAEDSDITLQLKHILWPQLKEQELEKLYFDVEEPLIDVLAQMELTGVCIDSRMLNGYASELSVRMAELERMVREEAGDPTLNINSTRQLGETLFVKMRIAEKPKMTRTKQFCTEEEYLQNFADKHRIVALILEYRSVKKLLSTYIEALPALVNTATGRIHTSFNQAVTATGRLSSANPNLQNIPVRDEMGRRIREAFIPSDSDHLLLSADYSQVELRIMAHLSGDEGLIDAFCKGEDIHTATAARLFGKSIGEVTDEERRRAKTANFGIIYGISAFGLSQRLEIPRGEAKTIIEDYFASYPKVREYMDNAAEQARSKGYVSTIYGRRRYLADISSRNAIARGYAERNAINAPIQGSAADIMKIAMTRVAREFALRGLKSRMILQVHDEIVVDVLRSELDTVTDIVREAMEGAAQLSVPLTTDCGVGTNWLMAH
ncbi:MAG: DNA polymerase I [Alistipes sp.]|nr:DNA polymerase I [Alistipes sp.]